MALRRRIGQRTIVDVLKDVLGSDWTAERVEVLSASEIEHLAVQVADLYAGQYAPADDDAMRVYSGGWVARNFGDANRPYLLTSLLYAPLGRRSLRGIGVPPTRTYRWHPPLRGPCQCDLPMTASGRLWLWWW